MMSNCLVVGAGISGPSIANLISSECTDCKIEVIDEKDAIGGNCFDYRDGNGIMVHRYGSHIFHTSNKKVWDFLSQFTSFNTYMHRVYAVIEGNEVPIPFNFDSIRRCFPVKCSFTLISCFHQIHSDQIRDRLLILHDQYVVHPRFLPVWGYCNPVLLQGCVLTAIILHFFILFSTRVVV